MVWLGKHFFLLIQTNLPQQNNPVIDLFTISPIYSMKYFTIYYSGVLEYNNIMVLLLMDGWWHYSVYGTDIFIQKMSQSEIFYVLLVHCSSVLVRYLIAISLSKYRRAEWHKGFFSNIGDTSNIILYVHTDTGTYIS